MDKELKRINSEVIKIFNDFISSITINVDDVDEYFAKESLRCMILDLITGFDKQVIVKLRRNDNNEYELSGIQKRIYDNIIWIRDNLDVWNVVELPEDTENHIRIFEFKRIDLENVK
jgi:hypothetical protein